MQYLLSPTPSALGSRYWWVKVSFVTQVGKKHYARVGGCVASQLVTLKGLPAENLTEPSVWVNPHSVRSPNRPSPLTTLVGVWDWALRNTSLHGTLCRFCSPPKECWNSEYWGKYLKYTIEWALILPSGPQIPALPWRPQNSACCNWLIPLHKSWFESVSSQMAKTLANTGIWAPSPES